LLSLAARGIPVVSRQRPLYNGLLSSEELGRAILADGVIGGVDCLDD